MNKIDQCHQLTPRGLPWGLVAAGMAASMRAAAQTLADSSADDVRAPAPTLERNLEDWSYLAAPGNRTGRWTEPLKYIPLNEDGSTYLTTGIEMRLRYERFENRNWGAAPDDDYIWHRAMPYFDLHAGKFRLFAQPIASGILRAQRERTPIDTTGADMLQAFVEASIDLGEDTQVHVSVGRKLLFLGSGRLVETRHGPNVPLAFDGVEARVADELRQVRLLWVRPVHNKTGSFNDGTSRQQTLWGAYATQWAGADKTSGFDLYYLGLRDEQATYDQGTGEHIAHTFGGRWFGHAGPWSWNIESALQRGRFEGHRAAAWGTGAQVAYRFRQRALEPMFGLDVDYIPGDDDPDDPRLDAINALFAGGRYFGQLSTLGPRNLMQIRLPLTLHPRDGMTVSLIGARYWRESMRDGIYSMPGMLVRSGQGSTARAIGSQLELSVAYQATPELNLSASVNAFYPGAFIRETGPARTLRTMSATATFRF